MQEKEQLMISTHMEQLPEDVQIKFLQAYEKLSRQDKDVMLMELQALYPEFRDQDQSSPQMKFGGSLLDMEKPKYQNGGKKDPYKGYHGAEGKQKLQGELERLGYEISDKEKEFARKGKLGRGTGKAVKAFQISRGLDDDGIAGPLTLAALRQASQTGARQAEADLSQAQIDGRAAEAAYVPAPGSQGNYLGGELPILGRELNNPQATQGDVYDPRGMFERMKDNVYEDLQDPSGFLGKYALSPGAAALGAAYVTPNSKYKIPMAMALGLGSMAEEAMYGTDYLDVATGATALGKAFIPKTTYFPINPLNYGNKVPVQGVPGLNAGTAGTAGLNAGVNASSLPAGAQRLGLGRGVPPVPQVIGTPRLNAGTPPLSFNQATGQIPKSMMDVAQKTLGNQKMAVYNKAFKGIDINSFSEPAQRYLHRAGISVAKLSKSRQASAIRADLNSIKNRKTKEAEELRKGLKAMMNNLKGVNNSFYRFGGKK
jgi:peptidoglycan hydrolase-like protein with peptidoglycan-binding domain